MTTHLEIAEWAVKHRAREAYVQEDRRDDGSRCFRVRYTHETGWGRTRGFDDREGAIAEFWRMVRVTP